MSVNDEALGFWGFVSGFYTFLRNPFYQARCGDGHRATTTIFCIDTGGGACNVVRIDREAHALKAVVGEVGGVRCADAGGSGEDAGKCGVFHVSARCNAKGACALVLCRDAARCHALTTVHSQPVDICGLNYKINRILSLIECRDASLTPFNKPSRTYFNTATGFIYSPDTACAPRAVNFGC